jgi:hypothetical protein
VLELLRIVEALKGDARAVFGEIVTRRTGTKRGAPGWWCLALRAPIPLLLAALLPSSGGPLTCNTPPRYPRALASLRCTSIPIRTIASREAAL